MAASEKKMTRPPLYLCAPVNALVEGIYEENIPLVSVLEHGDFGLGTFNDLDGEMVVLDGQAYQITANGNVRTVASEVLTPFACVTTFQPFSYDDLPDAMDGPQFDEWLKSLLPSENVFYAIRVDGHFSYVKARSVPKQENYRSLVEVAKEQSVFEFEDVDGCLAGFYTPSFMASLNVPGIHLHYLSADREHGGHLLTCCPDGVRVSIQIIDQLELSLPMSVDYLGWNFERDIAEDLEKVEK